MRLPGQSLDEKLIDLVNNKIIPFFVAIALTIFFIFLEWVRAYWLAPPRPALATVIGGVVIIYCGYKIRKNAFEARSVRRGRDGERTVGQQLEELRDDGCSIFHDVLGAGFNIDHIVVAPQGIFTIETKMWRGNEMIKLDGNDGIINGRYIDRHPIQQSLSEAIYLHNILKKSTGKEFLVKPVIVFPRRYVDQDATKRAQEKGIWLLNPKALPSFIKSLPKILNDEDLRLVAYVISITAPVNNSRA